MSPYFSRVHSAAHRRGGCVPLRLLCVPERSFLPGEPILFRVHTLSRFRPFSVPCRGLFGALDAFLRTAKPLRDSCLRIWLAYDMHLVRLVMPCGLNRAIIPRRTGAALYYL